MAIWRPYYNLATSGDLATWRPGDRYGCQVASGCQGSSVVPGDLQQFPGDLLATYWLYLLATWRPTAQVCYCVARSAKAENVCGARSAKADKVCGARSAKAEIACGARSANDKNMYSAKPLLKSAVFRDLTSNRRHRKRARCARRRYVHRQSEFRKPAGGTQTIYLFIGIGNPGRVCRQSQHYWAGRYCWMKHIDSIIRSLCCCCCC